MGKEGEEREWEVGGCFSRWLRRFWEGGERCEAEGWRGEGKRMGWRG